MAEQLSNRRAESLVAVGVRAQLMIEVRDPGYCQLARFMKRMKEVCQRDRIAAAGQCDDDTRRRRRKMVAPNRPQDDVKQGHRPEIHLRAERRLVPGDGFE